MTSWGDIIMADAKQTVEGVSQDVKQAANEAKEDIFNDVFDE